MDLGIGLYVHVAYSLRIGLYLTKFSEKETKLSLVLIVVFLLLNRQLFKYLVPSCLVCFVSCFVMYDVVTVIHLHLCNFVYVE